MENFFFSMSYRFQNTYAYALCKHCEALLKKFRVKILVLGSLYESVIKFVNTKINPFWSSILLLTINFDTILLHNKFTVLWSGGHWWGHNRKQTDPAHQCCGTKSIKHLKEKKGYRIFLRWKTFISMPYRFQNIYSSIERHCLKKFWVKILVLGSVSESVIKFVNPKINPFRSSILLLTISFDTLLLHNKFIVLWSGGHWWGRSRKPAEPVIKMAVYTK
jgi:hypothetical protein